MDRRKFLKVLGAVPAVAAVGITKTENSWAFPPPPAVSIGIFPVEEPYTLELNSDKDGLAHYRKEFITGFEDRLSLVRKVVYNA